MTNRRQFTARVSALFAAPLVLICGRSMGKSVNVAMIVDFQNDLAMASAICRTHEFIDMSTGKTIVNPDGGHGIYFGDEATGTCRAYRVREPYVPGKTQRKYVVIAGTDIEATKTDYPLHNPYGAHRPIEIAWHQWNAPIRFIPTKGKEKEAAEVRQRFAYRKLHGIDPTEVERARFFVRNAIANKAECQTAFGVPEGLL